MEIRKRMRCAIAGGFFCAVMGIFLVGLFIVFMVAIHSRPEDLLNVSVSAVLYASILSVPFGLFFGSIGGYWLSIRLDGAPNMNRVFLESAVAGALLGSTYPLIMSVLGFGPFRNLMGALPLSSGVGIICGLAFTAFLRTWITRILTV